MSNPSNPNLACEGLRLRDYFAGQALSAMIQIVAAGQHMPTIETKGGNGIAQQSYVLADAMLKAREA